MGGRLSVPRSADGITEVSRTTSPRVGRRGNINGRTVVAPLAALTMACLLFVYSRTSIRAAKLNAQKHREADGGQISWHNESRRRHGQLERIGEKGILKEVLLGDKKPVTSAESGKEGKVGMQRSSEEDKLRKAMGKDD
ncbi:hypothetical protein K432DRAFT_343254 [Lepidopterella palustris CBS 459.81]|uniref:Uncharacterized protein n=1 Tax=Lepidopterella palustris CBS 459.81 TaxID=1314670 RepID=A0A8E2JK25_9PEZI|nr:hypothetical protein K432DRAFT_343254 [Lepidopterella palustris CBS 459.81]